MREITITANDAGRRLDRFLRKYLPDASLGEIYKFIRKNIKVDSKRRSESYILEEGNVLTLYLSDEALLKCGIQDPGARKRKDSGGDARHDQDAGAQKRRTKRSFSIVYEDDAMLIAGKPYGLLTHGDSREKKNHLANQVKDYLIESGSFDPRAEKVFTPAPVNRLDRNTTGLVLFGKTSESMRELNRMIREDEIRKYYLTLACGVIDSPLRLTGSLEKDGASNTVSVGGVNAEPLTGSPKNVSLKAAHSGTQRQTAQRHAAQNERSCSDKESALTAMRSGAAAGSGECAASGADKSTADHSDAPSGKNEKDIETLVKPLKVLSLGAGMYVTLCEVCLVTGRTHQIRAHLASIGHPLAGDSKYAAAVKAGGADPGTINTYMKKRFGLTTQLLHAYKVEFPERSFEAPLPERFARVLRELERA